MQVGDEPGNDAGDVIGFPIAMHVGLAKTDVAKESELFKKRGVTDAYLCCDGRSVCTEDLAATVWPSHPQTTMFEAAEGMQDEGLIETASVFTRGRSIGLVWFKG